LEGALRRIIANSQLIGTPITLDFAKEALADLLAVQAKTVTIENIQKTVAEYYKIQIGKAFGGRDHTTVLHACRKIEELRESDDTIREDYSNLMRTLSS